MLASVCISWICQIGLQSSLEALTVLEIPLEEVHAATDQPKQQPDSVEAYIIDKTSGQNRACSER